MKIVGAILIIFSCQLLSMNYYKKIEKFIDFQTDLIDGFKYIKSEIGLSMTIIADIFISTEKFSGSAGIMFSNCGKAMKNGNKTLSECWYTEIENLKIKDEKLKTILFSVGNQLGRNDTDGEQALLENTIEKISDNRDKSIAVLKKEGNLLKKAGLLAGIVIIIILF